jgi:glutamate carboxypeptidase
MNFRLTVGLALAFTLATASLAAQSALTSQEQRIRDAVASSIDDQIAYIQRVVDVPSSTLNFAGVRRVADVFAASFDSLGFATRWIPLPDSVQRAGHFVAVHRGKPGTVRMLLIGHLDTVVEPDGPTFVRQDSVARGVGGGDMKGGDVIILYALKALAAAGALDDLNVTVIFTGDEEHPGEPLSVTRRDLIQLAHENDVALAFEGGNRHDVTIARRGSSSWHVIATGRQAHSAGVFGRGVGFGANYELARIINGIREQLSNQQYLTLNVATIVGGTDVTYDSIAHTGTTASKLNIVPRKAIAYGDLRFISEEQKAQARATMRDIVSQHLPGTGAEVVFEDFYPAMSPTAGNERLRAVYDTASQLLGYGSVEALDPGRRGAGDISFVAPFIDGLDGLGAMGRGSHSPDEVVDLATLPMQTERAALLMRRVGVMPAVTFER